MSIIESTLEQAGGVASAPAALTDPTALSALLPSDPYEGRPVVMDEQAKREVSNLKDLYPELDEVNIKLVWTPFWNPSMMSQEARDELGFY